MRHELSMKEAEMVNGGTVGEMHELISAMIKDGFTSGVCVGVGHTPGLNLAMKDSVINDLKKLGIRAEIDLGWGGTGICSDPNKYWLIENGQPMTHQQVLSYIASKV